MTSKQEEQEELKNLTNLVFELGQLKRVKRSGWWLINIKDPESVAEHSFRAAAIGYFLAKLENADADKVMRICLFNDIHETRINDLHKVGHKYINFKEAEKKVFDEQILLLPKKISKELAGIIDELQNDSTKEGVVARDADLLECAFQAKEYIDSGHKNAQNWLDNIRKIIKTKTGAELLNNIEKTNSNEWWKDLKKPER